MDWHRIIIILEFPQTCSDNQASQAQKLRAASSFGGTLGFYSSSFDINRSKISNFLALSWSVIFLTFSLIGLKILNSKTVFVDTLLYISTIKTRKYTMSCMIARLCKWNEMKISLSDSRRNLQLNGWPYKKFGGQTSYPGPDVMKNVFTPAVFVVMFSWK